MLVTHSQMLWSLKLAGQGGYQGFGGGVKAETSCLTSLELVSSLQFLQA